MIPSTEMVSLRSTWGVLATVAAAAFSPGQGASASRAWFQTTEQSLMNAVAVGDRAPWNATLDDRCVLTTEEGEVLTKAEFLKALRPLPAGLAGGIEVKDLTVEDFQDVAVVRFLADEWETVFAQRLTTKYRMTDTFRRVDGVWKMIASHASVVTANPPAQPVSTAEWPELVGAYQIKPDGWTFHVELRNGQLVGGRDPNDLKRMIPLTPLAFVRDGSLGEWLFVMGADKKATAIINFRKFEPLVWTRVGG
jgi:hypothetical protein